MRTKIFVTAGILAIMVAGAAFAGSLDAPAAPTDAGSAMYTLESIYNRLATGAAGTKRPGPFAEPTAGPGSTGHTLDEVMGLAPALDNTNGASTADVLSGKTFWGLTGGAWGLQKGNVPAGSNVSGAVGSLSMTIPDGLYSGSKTATASDPNLMPGNIRAGVTIFGVSGTLIPPCTGTLSPLGRWCDQGNGSVMDMTTGLIWLKNAYCRDILAGINVPQFGFLDWNSAMTWVTGLQNGSCGLTDGSAQGQWRLPTKSELLVLISGTEKVNIIYSGTSGPFIDVQMESYWSATPEVFNPGTPSPLGRWSDLGNGTIMDMTTGLVWLKEGACTAAIGPMIPGPTGEMTWDSAMLWATGLFSGRCGLTGSTTGFFHMPALSELLALTSGTEALSSGSPGLFSNVQNSYWSATPDGGNAWYMDMNGGGSFTSPKTNSWNVLPVRDELVWAVSPASGGYSYARPKAQGFLVWPVR